MTTTSRAILVCTCQNSVSPDLQAIARACPNVSIKATADPAAGDFAGVIADARTVDHLTVACACRAAAIADVLEDAEVRTPVSFVNIRETAGWSREAASAGPKIAALVALAQEPAIDVPMVSLDSQGVTIIYGNTDVALAVAHRLADDLDITVLLNRADGIVPSRHTAVPVFSGTIRAATGRLGAFELKVDRFAMPAPSSRGSYVFGPARNGAASHCDIVIDLTGGTPLFPADDLRPGYLRADPARPAEIERLIAEARDLVGTFDKPKYITFKQELCAHSRSKITGCTRCIDVCPTGAISPATDAVAIDPAICAGCGGCSAVCPTGAASYALPAPDRALQRLRTLLSAYHAAGGTAPVLLLHDGEHGEALIHMLAHGGTGLPARVLPFAVNETTQIGLEWLAAALAYGAVAVRILTRSKPRHDESALHATVTFARAILSGLGFAEDAVAILSTDDPDQLADALDHCPASAATPRRASFLPIGGKRQIQRLALRELHAIAPAPVTTIALPSGAPMGRITVEAAGCTLCLACVSACPAEALRANPDRPELRFSEDLCIQCGLCARTCPEKVITLEPRLDFAAIEAGPMILKEEDPHACERCGKLFGTKATIRKIREKLAGNHWMFSGANADRAALIGICDDCRIITATERAIDPYAGAPRPAPRTAEDYRREREGLDLEKPGSDT
jgi:ferredoxin